MFFKNIQIFNINYLKYFKILEYLSFRTKNKFRKFYFQENREYQFSGKIKKKKRSTYEL